MASLTDSFLADLDELSDNEAYPEEDNVEPVGVDEDGDDDMPDLESLNYDDLDSISKLHKTQRYIDIMQICGKRYDEACKLNAIRYTRGEPIRSVGLDSDGLGEGYGMLGQAGNGRLRVSAAQNKLAAKVAKKFKEKSYGSSGATSGLTSSLAFTPVQGIELSNPQAHGNLLGSGTQNTYFSENGTFSRMSRPGG